VLKGLATKEQTALAGSSDLSYILSSTIRENSLILYSPPGNVDDRHPLTGNNLLAKIYGKLFADKGYIS